MGAIFSYSLYSSIILLSLYLCYKWMMAGENQHRFNRAVLWVVYTVALAAFPAVCIVRSLAASPVMPAAEVDIEGVMITFDTSDIVDAPSQPLYLTLLLVLYMLGVGVALLHTVWVGVRLSRVIAKGERRAIGNYTLVLIDDDSFAPFSWCRFIVMSRRDWEESGEMIAVHEMQHLCLCHWVDLLLAQCVAIFQWYNPAAWLMREELKAVHEYQADSAVIDAGVNARDYQMLLIKKAVGARFPSLANSLNHSKLKKRITMMYNSKTSRFRRIRGLALVPAYAAALLVTNIPAVAGLLSDASSATVFSAGDAPGAMPVESVSATIESSSESVSQKTEPLKTDEIVVVAYETDSKGTEKSEPMQLVATSKTAGTIESESVQAASSPDDDNMVFDVVEEHPQFPGGEVALMKFIAENVRYPQEAQKAKIQGRVIAQFVITKTGSIGDVKIIRGRDAALDKEAVRVIKMLPAFTPGKVNGQPVSVWYTIPISFKLTGNNDKKVGSDSISISFKLTVNNDKKVSSDSISSVFIDGEEVPYEELGKINPSDVERIDIMKDRAISIRLKEGTGTSKK